MGYTVFMKDRDGDEIWLAQFDLPGQAESLVRNLNRGGIVAWMEAY